MNATLAFGESITNGLSQSLSMNWKLTLIGTKPITGKTSSKEGPFPENGACQSACHQATITFQILVQEQIAANNQ